MIGGVFEEVDERQLLQDTGFSLLLACIEKLPESSNVRHEYRFHSPRAVLGRSGVYSHLALV